MTAARALLVALLVLVAAHPARAEDAQLWVTVGVTTPARNPWRATFEVQPRWTGGMNEFNRLVYRVQAGHPVGNRLAVWFGYERTNAAGLRARDEHRLFQQASITAPPVHGWTTTHRFRIEERFLARADGMVARARYQIRAMHPLDHRRRWSVFGSEEVYFTLNSVSGGPRRGFDQNRWILGLGHLLTPTVQIEPAYSQQIVHLPSPLPRVRTHALQITISTKL